jgi:NADPH-dependent F420 reductase
MAKIALLGGTGHEGRGLALRFALAGEQVIVGSRSAERAAGTARALNQRCPAAAYPFLGATNAAAAEQADAACVCIPAAALQETLAEVRASLLGKTVIEVVNPIVRTAAGFGLFPVAAPSAAELVAALLPDSELVSAFKTIGARHLLDTADPLRGDALVSGDSAPAKRFVLDLVARMPHLRAVDCGPLPNARHIEAMTTLLLELNRLHGGTTSVRILDLPEHAHR